jgi:ribosome-binding protein aMBF1 (putative translation factor)
MIKTTKKRGPGKTLRVARPKTVRPRRATGDEARLPPPFPRPNAAGLVNALEQVRVSIAHELVRARRAAGLSQQRLAEMAHVRQETISRIESAKHTATPRVLDKLMQALASARPAPSDGRRRIED